MELRKDIILFLIFLLLLAGAGYSQENLVTNPDFEEGIAGWGTYRSEESKSSLSQSSEEAYAGKYSLKVETPGVTTLEGAVTSVKLTPGDNYFISAYAKGEGKVMICASGKAGWVYERKTTLTSEWQELKIKMLITGTGISPTIITSSGKNQKVAFYLDNVKVIKIEQKEMPAVEVEPIWYEAEDYKHNAWIVKDNSASGGAYAEGKRWYVLAHNVPFPQTSKSTYIYLKVWIDDNSKNVVTVGYGTPEQGYQTFFKGKVPVSHKWVWVKTGPFLGKEVGKQIDIGSTGKDKVKVRLDALVVTTRDNMTEGELNDIGKQNE